MAPIRKTITIFINAEEIREMNTEKPENVPMTVFYRNLVREGWKHKEELDTNQYKVMKENNGFWAHINIFLPLEEAKEHDAIRIKGHGYRGKMPMTTFYLQLLKIGWRHLHETPPAGT